MCLLQCLDLYNLKWQQCGQVRCTCVVAVVVVSFSSLSRPGRIESGYARLGETFFASSIIGRWE